MDVFTVQPDDTEQVLASGLDSEEVDELREWFCYTKPIGDDMKLVARPASEKEFIFCVHAAGNAPEAHVRGS
jgi:hypothetical protein